MVCRERNIEGVAAAPEADALTPSAFWLRQVGVQVMAEINLMSLFNFVVQFCQPPSTGCSHDTNVAVPLSCRQTIEGAAGDA